MPDPSGLDVHSIQVTTTMQANPQTGAAQRVHVVTYKVGDHGPFVDQYPPGTFTADGIKNGIAQTVATLRGVLSPPLTY